jgi:hypothetical protein
VIDNVVWTNSWSSIAGAGCGLICVGAGEEWARKQEKQDEVVDRSRCRVAAHDRSLHTGFAVVHQKTIGLLG